MSLDYTFVRCNNGQWYKNPVWWGSHDGVDWFICFDDEDPPEIVIALPSSKETVHVILSIIGVSYKLGVPNVCNGGRMKRMFPQDGNNFKNMKPTNAWFFNWESAPPRPQRPESSTFEKNVTGVMYPYGGPLPGRFHNPPVAAGDSPAGESGTGR